MTDVSCRLTSGLIAFLERSPQPGFSPEQAVALARARLDKGNPDAHVSLDILKDLKKRVSWEFFVHLQEVFDENLPQGWEHDYFEWNLRVEESWIPHLRMMASLISSPMQAYRMVNALSGPNLFGSVVVPTSQIISKREMVITLTIQKPHRDSPAFFRMSTVGIATLPRMLGLPPSQVKAEIVNRQARYTILMPASQTIVARAVRAIRRVFSFDKFLNELSEQEREFRENYARLQNSEQELLEARRILEERVQLRTHELQEANLRLEFQIESIVAKENENLELQEKLFHLQKVEAIGTLASGISHEMNNVLQGLVLALDLAERNLGGEHPARSSVLTATKFASRGRDVMRQLLGFSRKASSERTHMDVISTVQEAVELVRSILPKRIELKQIYPATPKPISIFGDRTQIQQVIINLASNAIHAMRSSGGEITIEIRDLGADCAIVVRDTGPGISKEIRSQIFEPFFTTKPIGEGTGMGLPVVQGIINTHLGRIELSPNTLIGSEFVITIPVSMPSIVRAESVTEESIELAGGDETILIVDDEADLTGVISDTLACFGYTTIQANCVQTALEILDRRKDEIDLVLTDDSMPGMSGAQLAEALAGGSYASRKLPVILMTGSDRVEPGEELANGSIRAFMRKPLDAEILNETIRSTLDRALS